MIRFARFCSVVPLLLGLAAWLGGCSEAKLKPDVDVNYDTRPTAIFNPDWGQIPLPNNFVNRVKQADIGVDAPCYRKDDPRVRKLPEDARMPVFCEDLTDDVPVTLAFPVVDEAAALAKQELGYDVKPDSALTLELLQGMNRLNGFVPGIIPRIPFSARLDMDSFVPFQQERDGDGNVTGDNAAEANFFFLDVTDPENPVAVDADDYFRVFDFEMNDDYPYFLTLRNKPTKKLTQVRGTLPKDYDPGHSYLAVVTGLTDAGVKTVDGDPVLPDNYFLMFASETPYFMEWSDEAGMPVTACNVLTDPAAIQELEGARQITNWGLDLWESIVGEGRSRNEVATAFHFTIAANPMPVFMDPSKIQLNQNPVLARPADYFTMESDHPICADAAEDAAVSFSVSREVALPVTDAAVRLFRKTADGYERVNAAVVAENKDGKATVEIQPDGGLARDATYLVAVTSALKGTDGLAATDESYYGLTRVTVPLVKDDMWQSPHLDSRIDAMAIFGGFEDMDKEDLDAATATTLATLGVIEKFRQHYQAPVTWLLQNRPDFVPEREDLALLYTFTTGETCAD